MIFNLSNLSDSEVNDILQALAFKTQSLIGKIQQQCQAQAEAQQPKETQNGTPDQL